MTDSLKLRYETGMNTRKSVLGESHVARAQAAKTVFDAPFQDYIVGAAWHDVWSGEHFTKRERSIVTLTLLAAMGHHEELAMHLRATQNTGATPEDIREAFMHVAVYAGVPAANTAFKIAKTVYSEMDAAAAGGENNETK